MEFDEEMYLFKARHRLKKLCVCVCPTPQEIIFHRWTENSSTSIPTENLSPTLMKEYVENVVLDLPSKNSNIFNSSHVS